MATYATLADLMQAEYMTDTYNFDAWANAYDSTFEVRINDTLTVFVYRTEDGYYQDVCTKAIATKIFSACVARALDEGFNGAAATAYMPSGINLWRAEKLGFLSTWCGHFDSWGQSVKEAELVQRNAIIDARMGKAA